VRLPRISVGMLIAAILIVAVSLTVGRNVFRDAFTLSRGSLEPVELIFGVLPMLSVLCLCGILAVRDLGGRGHAPSFVVGFEVCGCAAVIIFLMLSLSDPDSVKVAVGAVCTLLATSDGSRTFPNIRELLLWTLVCSPPQMLFALVGGWLAKRIGLTLTIERPTKLKTTPAKT
jgi:hypothetical protein